MNNEELKHLQLKVRNQKITVATFQRKFNEATATIKLKDSGIIKLNAIIKSQNEDLKSKNEIIEKLQAEMKEALVHKTQVQFLREQLEKDSQKHSEQEDKLKQEINDMKNSSSLLQTRVKNQKENNASIQKKFDEATATIKIKTSEITSLKETVKSHEAQINADSGKIKNAMRINEDRKKALLHQNSQVQCLKQQLEKDAQTHSTLEEELKKEINEMKDSYVLLQEQMRDRELEDANVITDLKAKLQVKRQEKIDFVMKQMKSESKSRRVLSLINHQLNDFNGKFDSQTAELKEINCKFDKQTMELQELHKQIEELKMENQTLAGLYRSEKKLRQTLKSG